MERRGGARPGAGRKTKAETLQLPSLISRAIPDSENEKLIAKIFELGLLGSFNHAKLYMEYKYGKPQEHISVDIESNTINLERLNKTEVLQLHELTAKANSDTEWTEDNDTDTSRD